MATPAASPTTSSAHARARAPRVVLVCHRRIAHVGKGPRRPSPRIEGFGKFRVWSGFPIRATRVPRSPPAASLEGSPPRHPSITFGRGEYVCAPQHGERARAGATRLSTHRHSAGAVNHPTVTARPFRPSSAIIVGGEGRGGPAGRGEGGKGRLRVGVANRRRHDNSSGGCPGGCDCTVQYNTYILYVLYA